MAPLGNYPQRVLLLGVNLPNDSGKLTCTYGVVRKLISNLVQYLTSTAVDLSTGLKKKKKILFCKSKHAGTWK